jgi:hypothetical protein
LCVDPELKKFYEVGVSDTEGEVCRQAFALYRVSNTSFFTAVVTLELREEAELGAEITDEALIRILLIYLFD